MNKEEALIQDEIFFSLMQDALIISEEIKDLEYYLELDAETPTINEYQIFKTLYLKRKIALCLERLESLKEEQGLACSNALADTTRAQFLSLKQIIDTLDMVNQSREISMIYTKEEAEYIKECEDKREKSNPEVKQYPIKTRLTFAIYKTKEELSTEQRNKLRRLRLGTIASRIIFGVGLLVTLVTGHFIIALIIGICLLLIGLQYPVDKEQLLRKSKVKLATQASIENARFMERIFHLGIKDLQTASIEYSWEFKSYISYLYINSREEKKDLGKYV